MVDLPVIIFISKVYHRPRSASAVALVICRRARSSPLCGLGDGVASFWEEAERAVEDEHALKGEDDVAQSDCCVRICDSVSAGLLLVWVSVAS